MEKSDLRKVLRDVKYYYSRRETFNKASVIIGSCKMKDIAEFINSLMYGAPVKLNELYFYIYVENNTFESTADKMGFSYSYIVKQNRKLTNFLLKKINEKEKEDSENTKIFEKCK